MFGSEHSDTVNFTMFENELEKYFLNYEGKYLNEQEYFKDVNPIKGEFIRDENVQATYLIDLLNIFKEEKVEGEFVFTFVSTTYSYDKNPLYDLDMASYSVVKTYIDENGISYKDMPWEPKKSFYDLAEYYGKF